jgi:signal peptidase I
MQEDLSTQKTQPSFVDNDKKQESTPSFWRELLEFVILLVVVALPFRLFIAQPFLVSGKSMDPTFDDLHYLMVDEISYTLGHIKRGDVVVFRNPENPKTYFIKRIIGLPDERVVVQNGQTTIYNSENPNGFTLDENFLTYHGGPSADTTLGEDEFFVMGDNRPNSRDSRYFGPVNKKLLIGRAFLRLYPLNNIGILPGKIDL